MRVHSSEVEVIWSKVLWWTSWHGQPLPNVCQRGPRVFCSQFPSFARSLFNQEW